MASPPGATGDAPAPEPDRADAALAGYASTPVVRGAAARGITYGVSTGLIALAYAFVTRSIGVSNFGRFSTAMAIAAVAQGIGDVAVSAVGQRLLVATKPAGRQRLVAELVGLRFVLMPLATLAAVAFGLTAGYQRDLIEAIAVGCVGATLTVLAAAWTTPLVLELRAGRASLVEFARQLSVAGGLLVVALASGTIVAYAATSVVAGLIAVVVALTLIEPRWRRPAVPTKRTIELVARDASWLALAVAVNSLFLKILTIVASLRTNVHQLGLFAAATRISEVVASLPLLMAAVAFPLLSRAALDADHERMASAMHRVINSLLLLIGGIVIVLVVAAVPLIALFAGKSFSGAAPVLQIQAFALLASCTSQALVWGLIALRAERALVTTNLIGLVALLLLGIVLIGVDGARGAAFAAIGGETVLVIVTAIALQRVRHEALPHLGSALAIIALTVACALGGLALPIAPIVAGPLAAALFAALAVLFRLPPRELVVATRR